MILLDVMPARRMIHCGGLASVTSAPTIDHPDAAGRENGDLLPENVIDGDGAAVSVTGHRGERGGKRADRRFR